MTRNGLVGTRIRSAREAKSITASELARLVGVTPTAVWNWETNGITPRRETIARIAKTLEISEEFILTGQKDTEAAVVDITSRPYSAAQIIEEARARIAEATGFPLSRVKLQLEFTSE